MTSKTDLITRIRDELATRLSRLERSARDAHAAATDPDSAAESKYDTRSLEASYLAAGQARQVDDLAESLRIFESLQLPEFALDDAIAAGALVETIAEDGPTWFLLAPAAGGIELDYDGSPLTVLTPDSRLYQKLLDLRIGDSPDSSELTITEIR